MARKPVGRRPLNWAVRGGGRGFGQRAIFMMLHWETVAKTSTLQRCVLGGAAKVSIGVLGASVAAEYAQSLFYRQVFSRISLPRLLFALISLQLLKLNYRYSNKRTVCFCWSILEAHQAWGTLREVYTRREVIKSRFHQGWEKCFQGFLRLF